MSIARKGNISSKSFKTRASPMCLRNRKKASLIGVGGEWWETRWKRWSGILLRAFWASKASGLYSRCNQKTWEDSKKGSDLI